MGQQWSMNGRHLEILREAGDPEVFDKEDLTGSEYQPGTPDQFFWQAVERKGEGPAESHSVLEKSDRFFPSPEEARADINIRKGEDPSLQDLPIVDIS
jgi:hypothetical protein